MATALSFLYLLGGIQALFIALYLFLRKNKNFKVSLWLSLILLGLFFTLYDYFVFQNQLYDQVSHFLLLGYAFQLAFAPLTYFLIKGIVFPLKKIPSVAWIHLLPAVLHLAYGIITFHIHPLQDKIQYVHKILEQTGVENTTTDIWHQFFYLINTLQLIIYLILSYRLVKKYGSSNAVKNPISKRKLQLFFWTIVGIDLVILISALRIRYVIYDLIYIDIGPYLLIFLSLYLFYVAYFVILNPQVFEHPLIKYKSSTINASEKELLHQQLIKYMTREKPYLHQDLSIKKLSEQVAIPSRKLSQIINEYYGNFYDFVNQHRIREAKKLLKTDIGKQFSISGLGYEVGFNSKSSFYTAFKKFTGTTPTNYQKAQNPDNK